MEERELIRRMRRGDPAALALNPSTVKVRLHRGRKKLKQLLLKRGYLCESADL